jgi:hypothetical protein
MGRFLLAERETWYFGGGREMEIEEGVSFADDVREVFWGFFKADSVLACDVCVCEAGGKTSSALVVGVFGVELCKRLEGSSGLGSGGCALSDSVIASAAARSAARAASCGVVGAAGGACEGAMGWEGIAGG